MTFSDKIRSQITAADYGKCWDTNTPPPFAAFIDFTCNAFEKQLPAGIADLAVKICPRAENRIGLSGSFLSDSVLYEIFGEIVWLPKMDMFRGRPGFNKSLGTISAGEQDNDLKIEIRPLSELNTTKHLESWADYPSNSASEKFRTTLSNTITKMLELESQSNPAVKIRTIRRCIETFNEINGQFDNFIDTELREEIIDAVYEIALASGLEPEISDSIDNWREW